MAGDSPPTSRPSSRPTTSGTFGRRPGRASTGGFKQGLYPLPAPIGYLDRGPGKPKEIDPARGPLVRQAFELYDTGLYSVEQLAAKLRELGLTRRGGSALYKSGVSFMLNNPFYVGVVYLRRTGERFPGRHEPLVKRSLFDRVQARLAGKRRSTAWKHEFLFRRLFRCRECAGLMTGERQKGHVYYRCHKTGCPTKCVREEVVDRAVRTAFRGVALPSAVLTAVQERVQAIASSTSNHQEDLERSLDLQLVKLNARLARLTDALIDGLVDRTQFNRRRGALLDERARLQEARDSAPDSLERSERQVAEIFELAKKASLSYEHASDDLRRELIEKTTSNRLVDESDVAVELREPFLLLADARPAAHGPPSRNKVRTCDEVATRLWSFVCGTQLAERSGKLTA